VASEKQDSGTSTSLLSRERISETQEDSQEIKDSASRSPPNTESTSDTSREDRDLNQRDRYKDEFCTCPPQSLKDS